MSAGNQNHAQPVAVPQAVDTALTAGVIALASAMNRIRNGKADAALEPIGRVRELLIAAGRSLAEAAQPVAAPQGKPDGTLHADGYFTWDEGKRPAYVQDRGLPCKFYLAAPAAPAPAHPDDEAVDRFASMLKSKLAKAREKGRSGWADPEWPAADINRQLHEHATKGDPLDVAAYAMFLALRGEAATGAPAPALVPLTSAQIEEGRREWLEGPAGVQPSGFYAGVRFAEVRFGIGSKA